MAARVHFTAMVGSSVKLENLQWAVLLMLGSKADIYRQASAASPLKIDHPDYLGDVFGDKPVTLIHWLFDKLAA